jgi:hypothetical protein
MAGKYTKGLLGNPVVLADFSAPFLQAESVGTEASRGGEEEDI